MKRNLFSSLRSVTVLSLFAFFLLLWNQPDAFAAKYPILPDHQLNEYEKEVIQLVNQEREKHNIEPLKTYVDLSYVARTKSADMRDLDYYAHFSPKYGEFWEMILDHGIPQYSIVAENIYATPKTPNEAVDGWMNSEGHRKNILNPKFTHIGVGYVEGGRYGTYWTQMFYAKAK